MGSGATVFEHYFTAGTNGDTSLQLVNSDLTSKGKAGLMKQGEKFYSKRSYVDVNGKLYLSVYTTNGKTFRGYLAHSF